MAEGFKKAAVWLGLMADAPYSDDERDRERDNEPTQVAQRIDPPVERAERVPATAPAPVAPVPAPVAEANVTTLEQRRPAPVAPVADLSRIVTVHPRTYNEARTIGEHFRDGVPVIMNLSDMEDADAKRLIDFAAGLIFGLHGSIDRITRRVFLLSPSDVNVSAEDKERIAGGFFNQS